MATYTVTQVPGSKRKSPRNYTHAIIGKVDYAKMLATRPQWAATRAAEMYDYYIKLVGKKVGELTQGTSGMYITDKMLETAQMVAEYPNAQAYAAYVLKTTQEEVEKLRKEKGHLYEVLQWSQSLNNATKSIGTHAKHYLDVHVVETVILKP